MGKVLLHTGVCGNKKRKGQVLRSTKSCALHMTLEHMSLSTFHIPLYVAKHFLNIIYNTKLSYKGNKINFKVLKNIYLIY